MMDQAKRFKLILDLYQDVSMPVGVIAERAGVSRVAVLNTVKKFLHQETVHSLSARRRRATPSEVASGSPRATQGVVDKVVEFYKDPRNPVTWIAAELGLSPSVVNVIVRENFSAEEIHLLDSQRRKVVPLVTTGDDYRLSEKERCNIIRDFRNPALSVTAIAMTYEVCRTTVTRLAKELIPEREIKEIRRARRRLTRPPNKRMTDRQEKLIAEKFRDTSLSLEEIIEEMGFALESVKRVSRRFLGEGEYQRIQDERKFRQINDPTLPRRYETYTAPRDRQKIVDLYRDPSVAVEEIAGQFGVSDVTIRNIVKQFLTEQEMDELLRIRKCVPHISRETAESMVTDYLNPKRSWAEITEKHRVAKFTVLRYVRAHLSADGKSIEEIEDIIERSALLRVRHGASKKVKKVQAWIAEVCASFFGKENVVEEKRWNWLRYRSPMRVDVFVVSLKIAVEFHGVQHFRPVRAFGGTRSLIKTRARDRVKAYLLRKNGVPLVVFRYDEVALLTPEIIRDRILKAVN